MGCARRGFKLNGAARRNQRGMCTKRPRINWGCARRDPALNGAAGHHITPSESAPFPLSVHLPLSHSPSSSHSLCLSLPYLLPSLCVTVLSSLSLCVTVLSSLSHPLAPLIVACWVVLALAQGKKCHLWVFSYHVCVLFCKQSNVWCSFMLACSFLWHLVTLALAQGKKISSLRLFL